MDNRGFIPDALHEPGYVYQEATVNKIMADPAPYIPGMLAYLDNLIDQPDRWISQDTEQDVSIFYVLYLLSTLKAPGAYERFVGILWIPVEKLFNILGDELTEAYFIHLARTANGDIGPLMDLVADPGVLREPTMAAARALVRIAIAEPSCERAVLSCLLSSMQFPEEYHHAPYNFDDLFPILRIEHWDLVQPLYDSGALKAEEYAPHELKEDIRAARKQQRAQQQEMLEEIENSTVAEGVSFLGGWDPSA